MRPWPLRGHTVGGNFMRFGATGLDCPKHRKSHKVV